MRATWLAFTIVVVVAVTITCNDSKTPAGPTPPSQPPQTPAPAAPTLVRVELAGASTVAPGETLELTLTAVYSDASRKDVTANAQWSSNGSLILESLGPGRYRATKSGEAFISTNYQSRFSSRSLIIVPTGTFRVIGRVTENIDGNAGIAGASVRIRDGAGTGPETTTDTGGYYRLYGVKPDTDFLITRSGYADVSRRVTISTHSTVNIDLALAGPRLQTDGDYSVRFDWTNCDSKFRDDLRRRTYSAVVKQTGANVDVRFTEPEFLLNRQRLGDYLLGRADANGFALTAAHYFYYYYYSPSTAPALVERVDNSTRLVTFGVLTLTRQGSGFTGVVTDGGALVFGASYPQGTFISACTAGNVVFTRR